MLSRLIAAIICLACSSSVAAETGARLSSAGMALDLNSRIRALIDGKGTLGGHGRVGIVWPGPKGEAFLGEAGLVLRFRAGSSGGVKVLGLEDFEEQARDSAAEYAEGCAGGIRYPNAGCDDDGDGLVDEDRPDLVDNDGDGEIDEDFGTVGQTMVVTVAEAPEYGLRVYQRASCWNYGHVRDFVGFTTSIERMSEKDPPETLELTAILYADFDAGPPDEPMRGRDDRFFMTGDEALGRAGGVPAVSDAAQGGPMAALVLLSAAGPDGPARASSCILPATGDAGALKPCEGASDSAGGSRGAMQGDMAAAYSVGPLDRLGKGERIVLDWAIVFGEDEAALGGNIERARETYRGMKSGDRTVHWVVPARKAARIEVRAYPSPVWVQGQRRLAAAVELPSRCSEDVEWLRIGGRPAESFEHTGEKVIALVEQPLPEDGGGGLDIEGQLTDGTLFTAKIGPEELEEFAGDGDVPPGRLPPGSIKLFPNPFETDLTIDIEVHGPSDFPGYREEGFGGISSLRIYDVKGRVVRTVLEGESLQPGQYSYGWDGKDENGVEVAPGVYYCKLQTGQRSLTKRVILLR